MSEYLYKKDLLEFLENERIREWRESCRSEDANKARRLAARGVVYKEVIEKIKSGAFDVRKPEPPALKPGDKVRHKDMSYLGTGVVRQIAKSGVRALVDWGDDWDRRRINCAPIPAYYRIDKLVKVEADGHDA